MIRWDAFNDLCGYLRAGLLARGPETMIGEPQWELLIEASSHHYVTPALAWSARDDHDIDPEVRDYLAAILALNTQRNAHLARTLERAAHALNAIGIAPILLKGAAHLAQELYPAPGVRVLGDLDLLVPGERLKDITEALERAGFSTAKSHMLVDVESHYLPQFRDPETGVPLDLHKEIVAREWGAIVAPSGFDDRCRDIVFRGCGVRVPGTTDLVAHIVVHNQLDHRYYRRGNVELRQLLDLALISARHGDEIDWAALDRRFDGAGYGTVLSTNFHFVEVLLQQSVAKFTRPPRPDALEMLRETVEHPARQRRVLFNDMIARYVARLRARPLAIFNLLSLRAWPARIRMIRQALGERKW